MRKAVITADIEGSTQLPHHDLEVLFDVIKQEISRIQAESQITEVLFYRGDSFQLLVDDPREALRAAMILKASVNKIVPAGEDRGRGKKVRYDLAASIGLGDVTSDKAIAEQNEKPFILSGRGLERLKDNDQTIGIFTGSDSIDQHFETVCYLYQWIMNQWSLTSAELIYFKLWGLTEREIAGELGISQPAVNQRSHAACWSGLERILRLYRETEEQHHA